MWQCRDCQHKAHREYYYRDLASTRNRKNAGERRRYAALSLEAKHVVLKRNNLRNLYGISLEEYTELYRKQEGRCFICHKLGLAFSSPSQKGRVLVVDHNHETGKVRALLCSNCNALIGMAHEKPGLLEKMLKYLTQPPLVLGKPDDAIPHASSD